MFAFGQSKTEEAKEKLDKGKKESKKSNDSHDDSEDEEDDSDGFFDVLFWEVSKGFAYISFNLPVSVDEETPPASQYVAYNKYPYEYGGNNSFRTSETDGNTFRFQLQFALGHNSIDDMNSQEGRGVAHYKSWAFRLNYKYLKELKAPYPIRNFLFMAERKSMSFSFMDMGFLAGYNLIRIGEDNYNGFAMGYNLEIFPVKPVSVNFNPNITFYETNEIVSWITGINLHVQSYYVGLEYNIFKIAGVEFNHAQLKIGKYF